MIRIIAEDIIGFWPESTEFACLGAYQAFTFLRNMVLLELLLVDGI